jgi:uncharacterized protein YjiS (DUF1127 family)
MYTREFERNLHKLGEPTPYERYYERALNLRAQVAKAMARSSWRALVAFGGQMLAGLQRWNTRRANIRALMNLSDRQLRDIGLTRGQIPEVVDAALNRRVAVASSVLPQEREFKKAA